MERRSGRPRAIAEDIIPVVFNLYNAGLGYRAIARELTTEYSVSVDWSTIRRIIKGYRPYNHIKLVLK